MRFSEAFFPTLKEAPADAVSVSHKLMVRAGMVRQTGAGIYSYLPLGYRVVRKMKAIVREEMDRAGGQEFYLPGLQPAELWRRTGRLEGYGDDIFRLKDRHGHELVLGPTHEEVITQIVAKEIRSWAQLPKLFYQIQTKFRDEARPRFGILRTREFTMKDLYSFDADEKGLDKSYRTMFEAYCRIFQRCGLAFEALETAQTGQIGGTLSHEFVVLAESGEDRLVKCRGCGYCAPVSEALCKPAEPVKGAGETALREVKTPGMTRVEQVAEFLGMGPERLMKTLIVERSDGRLLAAVIRGDHELSMAKLAKAVGDFGIRMASAERIEQLTGGPVGFSGPVGLKGTPIVADASLKGASDMVVGANKADAHYVGCQVGRDFVPERFVDIRKAVPGDLCPKCGKPYDFETGIEVGHIFKLGTRYSERLGAKFTDRDGQERPIVMGCYGLGIERTVAAAVEQSHDERGMVWPKSLAPYLAIVIPTQANDARLMQLAEKCYNQLVAAGVEVILDDRDCWPGVKFADADLIGVPTKIVFGKRGVLEGKMELQDRRTGRKRFLPLDAGVEAIRDIVVGDGNKG